MNQRFRTAAQNVICRVKSGTLDAAKSGKVRLRFDIAMVRRLDTRTASW